jgi:hypothetical protein
MTTQASAILILVVALIGFPLVFIGFWIVVTRLLSRLGGWGRLAERYAAGGLPDDGRILRRVTGMFGMTRYSRVLTVITTDTGIYIDIRRIYRSGHPPLFIPFSAMVDPRTKTLFFWQYIAFDVDDPPIASIRLPSKVFEGTPIVAAA